MMASQHSVARPLLIGPNQFLIGYQAQREWAWLIACAFFFGKVGAGTFLLSYLIGFKLGALVGLLAVGVLKTTAHLLFLGRPARFLYALRCWRTSWISRGIHGIGIFLVFGALYLSPEVVSFVPDGLARACGVVAALAAVLVMVYDGFVMKASKGIPFWDSYLMPVLVLCYALLGGTTVTLALQVISGEATESSLEWLQVAMLVLNLVLIGVVVFSARVRSAAAQLATALLTRGPLGAVFLVIAVGVGIVATGALVTVSLASGSHTALVAGAMTDLVGHFFVFFSVLRAGLHPPIRPLALTGMRLVGAAR